MRSKWLVLGAWMILSMPSLSAATFAIDNIHVREQAQTSGDGIMIQDPAHPSDRNAKLYIPQVEVQVSVSSEAQSQNLLAKPTSLTNKES